MTKGKQLLKSKDLMQKVLISPKWSNENCWLWLGAMANSVPQYQDHTYKLNPRFILWQSYNSDKTYPTNLEILMPTCGITECVNPYHLEKLPRKEAIKKGFIRTAIASKERYEKITHCPRGHEYNSTNTGISFATWSDKPEGKVYKGRYCIICNRERSAKRRKLGATRLDRDYSKGGLLSVEVIDREFKRPPRKF